MFKLLALKNVVVASRFNFYIIAWNYQVILWKYQVITSYVHGFFNFFFLGRQKYASIRYSFQLLCNIFYTWGAEFRAKQLQHCWQLVATGMRWLLAKWQAMRVHVIERVHRTLSSHVSNMSPLLPQNPQLPSRHFPAGRARARALARTLLHNVVWQPTNSMPCFLLYNVEPTPPRAQPLPQLLSSTLPWRPDTLRWTHSVLLTSTKWLERDV